MSSTPLEEHDYIGLSSEPPLMEKPSKSSNMSSACDNKTVLNLKATELCLGLPGLSQDFEEHACKDKNKNKNKNINSCVVNNIVSGAKRGFCDVGFDGSIRCGFDKGSEGVNDGLDGEKREHCVVEEKKKGCVNGEHCKAPPPAAKAQVVGWPPIRSFRKNTMAPNMSKNGEVAKGDSVCGGCLYVKVSMDGAPYLRKVDLKTCKNYTQLSNALEKMFNCFTLGQCNSIRGKEELSENNLKDLLHREECVLTYEDKDGDWMLVGDVPWEMFVDSCKRLRIMKGSKAIGLAPRSMEKGKNRIEVL